MPKIVNSPGQGQILEPSAYQVDGEVIYGSVVLV